MIMEGTIERVKKGLQRQCSTNALAVGGVLLVCRVVSTTRVAGGPTFPTR